MKQVRRAIDSGTFLAFKADFICRYRGEASEAAVSYYFRESLDVELTSYDGGSSRDNLDFSVLQTTPAEKFAMVCQVVETDLKLSFM